MPAGQANSQGSTGRNRSSRTLLIIGVVTLALLAASGCDGPGNDATPTTTATASVTPQETVGTVQTAAPTTPSGGQTTTQPPTGPQIVYFRVASNPSCPAGTNVNPIPGNPAKLEWKVTGANSTQLSVDGPGLYGDYAVEGSETINFPCSGTPGTYQSHTYTLTTVGGGSARSKTLTVKALINEIGQV